MGSICGAKRSPGFWVAWSVWVCIPICCMGLRSRVPVTTFGISRWSLVLNLGSYLWGHRSWVLQSLTGYLETYSSFHEKQCTAGKTQFLFFNSFLLVLTKFSFWQGGVGTRLLFYSIHELQLPETLIIFAGILHTFPTYQCLQKDVWDHFYFVQNLSYLPK